MTIDEVKAQNVRLHRAFCEASDKLDIERRKLEVAREALGRIRHMGTMANEHVRVAHEAFEKTEKRCF